jgi:(hydroxyamino)benzene mutase
MNISLFRHAFFLILLGLLGAFAIPQMAVPRLGLSAHTIAMLGGVLLIAVGAIWEHFRLSALQAAWLKWSWLYSSYMNWLACMTGAVLGVGRMTPIATDGLVGGELQEAVVGALFASVALASLIAVGLSLWGLRRSA